MLEQDKYWTKNIGLSVNDNENEISVFEVKELMLFREDAKSNAGYGDDKMLAAQEFLEFLDIEYHEILDADFVIKDKDDPVWLWVKFSQGIGRKKRGDTKIYNIQIHGGNNQIGNGNTQNNNGSKA
ncbi:hypothetical protein UNSWCS_259 [Campylobacter concisus UNSWCS]|jgi:hypothetical protein|uniref:Uncharacterized protein n=1 Tax=Campylobacter concisus UNSWCS TaxID=1242968 RepID=U2GVY9_9BACT|nr:hypothetical protein [Campylobacter concisus]ERJ30158.1 hypothetical protein UNSWCS_259 [Campylobacter concisus UNSWCS]